MSWKSGQSKYDTLISSITEYVSNQLDITTTRMAKDSTVINMARGVVADFVNNLRVSDVISIHDYLMYVTEMRTDNRMPVYVYSGGDRATAVTRYIQKNIDLELAKQFA